MTFATIAFLFMGVACGCAVGYFVGRETGMADGVREERTRTAKH